MRKLWVRVVGILLCAWSGLACGAAPSGPSQRSEVPELRVVRLLAGPRDKVFRAWTDGDAIREWFAYRADAHWVRSPAAEARPGSEFEWALAKNEDEHEVYAFHGRYRTVQPPRRLAFTWEWRSLPILGVEGPGHTLVTVKFVERGDRTEVTLTQSGFASQAARQAHEKGWNRCFDGIEQVLQERPPTGDGVVRVRSAVVALEHVRVIDGTGAPARPDQTIVITAGKIAAIGDAGSTDIPPGAQRLDLRGYSALPGLVGMHDHLFYSTNFFGADGVRAYDMPFSFPRLFLAAGVTTIRTTGSYEPYADLEIKKAIDAGKMIGPKMNVTGPYLEGKPFSQIQIHKLTGPDDARRTVEYWAAEGAGSFKAYAHITRAELATAIGAAHAHGLTITGHLCSIGFREAAEMGIDGVEHGLFVDSEFAADKQPDVCPDQGEASAADLDVHGEAVQATIHALIEHHVAVTSTLAVWEELLPPRRPTPPRVLRALSPEARKAYLAARAGLVRDGADSRSPSFAKIQRATKMLHKEMEFERAFVAAGGLLLAGSDAVLGGNLAGFGDQRELELLVEAGFTPLEATRIASLNGATFLGLADHVGSLEPGKQADIVLVRGDPSADIHAVENVELVFQDGVGYDSRKLIESVAGQVGTR